MRNLEASSAAEVLRAKSVLDRLTTKFSRAWLDSPRIAVELEALGWNAGDIWRRAKKHPPRQRP